jgi:hypothetical protein
MPDYSGTASLIALPTHGAATFATGVWPGGGWPDPWPPTTMCNRGGQIEVIDINNGSGSAQAIGKAILDSAGRSTQRIDFIWNFPIDPVYTYVSVGDFQLPSYIEPSAVEHAVLTYTVTKTGNVGFANAAYTVDPDFQVVHDMAASVGSHSVEIPNPGTVDFSNLWILLKITNTMNDHTPGTITLTDAVLQVYYSTGAVAIGHAANCNDYDPINLSRGAVTAPGNGLLVK